MSTQVLAGYKIQGQTAGGAAIGTVTVNYNSDGTWDFQDAAGNIIVYNGEDARANLLLQLAFVGPGGLDPSVKLFGFA